MDIKFKIKLYPITEEGEEIYHGGMIGVVGIDFINGTVDTWSEYSNPLVLLADSIFSKRRLDRWSIFNNDQDGRDQQTELWCSIDGKEYEQVNINKFKKERI